jgi:hypothetical protein
MDLRPRLTTPDGNVLRVWLVAWDDLGVDLAAGPGVPLPIPGPATLEIIGALSEFRADVRVEPLPGGDLRGTWTSPTAIRLRLPGRLRDALNRETAPRGRLPVLFAGSESSTAALVLHDLDTSGARVQNPGWSLGLTVTLSISIPDGGPTVPVRARVTEVWPGPAGSPGSASIMFEAGAQTDRVADRLASWLQARRTRSVPA